MCGIVCENRGVNSIEKIRHRGPDSQKIVFESGISFGFARLSINDKSKRGDQPFEYREFIGVFNGEIYNYKELIHKFKLNVESESDTEVILPLFSLIGLDILKELDGFYSGLIFDKKRKELFTIKDSIGKKPLFYVQLKRDWSFVSELKVIEEQIIFFQTIPKGISKLENRELRVVAPHQKYRLKKRLGLLTILENSVKKRVVEEPFGIFLSGGIDSTIIAYLSLKYSQNITFYTLGNRESLDVKAVKAIEDFLNIDVKYIEIPEDITKLIEEVVYFSESYNPSIISNGIGTYILSREARKDGLKTVLTGDGADEVFCGYSLAETDLQSTRHKLLEDLQNTELRRVDNLSMANSIELRNPFLDREVLAFADTLSDSD